MSLPVSVSVQVKANTVDVSSSIEWSTLDVTLVLTKEVGTCKFNVVNPGGTKPGGGTKYVPAAGDQIDVYETTNSGSGNVTSHLFGGTITETETTVRGLVRTVMVTATDWGYTMDGKLVVKSYANIDPADIVADIVSTYCPAGFNATTYVQRAGYLIPSIKFNYQSPTKCLQKLASVIGWEWNVDADKNIHFFLAENNAAAFPIDDTTGGIEWQTLDVDVNLQNMKNSVFVIGGVYKSPVTAGNTPDQYIGDGTQKTWNIRYAYTTATITITKNGVVQAIGVANQVTDPTLYDVIYDSANRLITFPIAPNNADVIKVYGTAEIPIIAHAIDQAAVATYGEHQDAIFDAQIKSIYEAQQRAHAEILLFGHAVYDVKFYTVTPGLRIGQNIVFNSVKFGISNYPLVVKRVEAVGNRHDRLRYQVECIGSDNVTFNDILTTLMLQENVNTQVDNTTLEVLLIDAETITVADALAQPVATTTGAYTYTSGAQPAVWNKSTWG